ncbi:MAG TPA: OsmC family protein [Bryobacteraceae bacterium]|nr:OsmC family protein [Bryobacteraceae bacterium]
MPSLPEHKYEVRTTWTGNTGQGTAAYTSYSRAHEISIPNKPPIPGTTEVPRFHDASRYTPEELLVAALSACHMMWLLHLCADAKITVQSYVDDAQGRMAVDGQTGQFAEVTLRPDMKITDPSRVQDAVALHEEAHKLCHIARSVNFPVHCDPSVTAE